MGSTGMATGPAMESPQSSLPPGVCLWRQGKLRDQLRTGPTEHASACPFVVRHNDFHHLLGPSPQLEKIADVDAHEGCLYYPDDNAILFTTTSPNKVKRICLRTGEVSTIMENTEMANGMVLDNEGYLLICEQGNKTSPAFIERMDLRTMQSSNIADNWFGRRFNGPNDIVVKRDGSIWFTDPDYPMEQGFGPEEPELKCQVYRIGTDGVVDVVADSFEKPNGLAFSPDEEKLYVTDDGFHNGIKVHRNLMHSVTVFDVKDGRHLINRRLFASFCSFDGSSLGKPDGLKVDTEGRVYVANPDGIHVVNSDGIILGLIRISHPANMGFGGPKLDTLYICNDSAVYAVKLQATGAGLLYAGKYHELPYYVSKATNSSSLPSVTTSS